MSQRFDLDRTQSAQRATAVTPSDSVELVPPARGIYIGTAGTIRILHEKDTAPVDYPVLIAGMVYPWTAKKIYATGTTATNIVAQY